MTVEEYKEKIEAIPFDKTEDFIFISYSHEDSEVVYESVLRWKEAGYNIYIDTEFAREGSDSHWVDQMQKTLKIKGCKAVVIFYSENYIYSCATLIEAYTIRRANKPLTIDMIVLDEECSTSSFSDEAIAKHYSDKYDRLRKKNTKSPFNDKEIEALKKGILNSTNNKMTEGDIEELIESINLNYDSGYKNYYETVADYMLEWRDKQDLNGNDCYDPVKYEKNRLPILFPDVKVTKEIVQEVYSTPVVEKKKEDNSSEYYRKAAKRIPQWADKPDQFNHKIVRAFFTAQEMDENVTIAAMERLCSDENSPELYVPKFKGNYDNMKLDTSNSHGKVFEDDGTNVRIWEEVEEVLLQYRDKFMKDRDAEVSNSSSNKEVSFEIYGEKHTGNQSDLMILSIGKVLKHNPQVIDKAIETLTSLSDVDYENNEIEDMPTYFRVCYTDEIAGKTVCIGTSYGLKDKLVQIAKVIALAEENPDVLKIDGLELPKVKIGKNTTKVAGGSGHGTEETYYIFGEKRTGNQSEMMFDYFEELAKRYPDKIAGLTQITSVKAAEDVSNPGTSAASPVYFRVCRRFQVAGVAYYVGTSYGKKDKLVQIRKMQMLCGAAQDSFRMEGEEIPASAVVTAKRGEKKKYVF